nr:hypothetical protein [Tanacetum cinerariifolium]
MEVFKVLENKLVSLKLQENRPVDRLVPLMHLVKEYATVARGHVSDGADDPHPPSRQISLSFRGSEGEKLENAFFVGDGSSSDKPPDWPRTLFVEPIIWDIGDIEAEYPFFNNYQNFKEEENNVSFMGVKFGVEEELMPVYDTDIEVVIEEKEKFVWKRGFGEADDSNKEVVVVAIDLCS